MKGISHKENLYGGYGGHAISFLEGSKGKIVGSGCGDTDDGGGTDPGSGGPEVVFVQWRSRGCVRYCCCCVHC